MKNLPNYYFCIDGGGTNSREILYDSNENILSSSKTDSGNIYNDVYKVTKKCNGCMYGSYPEVTITARYLSAFVERMQYFNFKTPKLKKVDVRYLQNVALDILNEQSARI